jgi:phage terminase small subunit|tara:strand:- start:100 stop:498 length:399 start_codon:yes stop_codon:yes gene_type:complete
MDPTGLTIDLPRKKLQVNDRQKALVDTLIRDNCSIEEASKVAGYKASTARIQGSQTLAKPHVKEYMFQQIQQSFGINSLQAVHTLNRLAKDAKSEYVQMESAKDILDRAGFKAPDKHQHQLVGDFKVHIDLG